MTKEVVKQGQKTTVSFAKTAVNKVASLGRDIVAFGDNLMASFAGNAVGVLA